MSGEVNLLLEANLNCPFNRRHRYACNVEGWTNHFEPKFNLFWAGLSCYFFRVNSYFAISSGDAGSGQTMSRPFSQLKELPGPLSGAPSVRGGVGSPPSSTWFLP